MSVIRCIYTVAPTFPATDQHPDAVRYRVGALWVDAIGGAPTQAEVDAALGLDAASQAEKTRLVTIDDNIRSTLIGTATPKTVAELKAMDWPTYSAWFDVNFDTAAKIIVLVKRVLLVVIRRVL